jgi:predicted nucleic acid-binding protein
VNSVLLDTNVVSILFNPNHSLLGACLKAVAGKQSSLSFMSRAEILLWPTANNWGSFRRQALMNHLRPYTRLYPDEETCALWCRVMDQGRRRGRPIQTADAWIAATALQWSLPLMTADVGDFAAVEGLEIIPVG